MTRKQHDTWEHREYSADLTIVKVRDHYEIRDSNGKPLASADTRREIEDELAELENDNEE